MEKGLAEVRALLAVQLYGGETHVFCGVAHVIHSLVDENADFLHLLW
jgi:hypothetical protein